MITILTGFMFGSLKKIWPWKEVLESVVIRNKTHVLEEANILPDMSSSTIFTILFMLIGFGLVFLIEFLGKKKN
jgi:putative membrane protein